jgi:ATP-dependent Clp protease ATP-binding subunit ClpC
VLIGEPGVGKTAIVEGLAQKIVYGDVPHFLADKRILALDISLIVAGTKYRGQFEERLKAIMKELTENPNIIVFIDELHTLACGFGGRLARRGQHPEAGTLAR